MRVLGAAQSDPAHTWDAHPGATSQVHPDQVLLLSHARCTGCQHGFPAPQEPAAELVICTTPASPHCTCGAGAYEDEQAAAPSAQQGLCSL